MLYNPNLYKEPSVADFADFVADKNPQERYQYANSEQCACAQYSHTKGMKGSRWLSAPNEHSFTWSNLNRIAGGHCSEWTFGQLHERLKKELEPA